METKCKLETICEMFAVERSDKILNYSRRKVDRKAYATFMGITKTSEELKYVVDYYRQRCAYYDRPVREWRCIG